MIQTTVTTLQDVVLLLAGLLNDELAVVTRLLDDHTVDVLRRETHREREKRDATGASVSRQEILKGFGHG